VQMKYYATLRASFCNGMRPSLAPLALSQRG
jgi:hypothetical protein